jgi:hypothetical protein
MSAKSLRVILFHATALNCHPSNKALERKIEMSASNIPSLKGTTLKELLLMEFPPLDYLVQDILPAEGLAILSGGPKIGKSWFALSLAIALASGSQFLGDIEMPKTKVIYVTLEDSLRRLSERAIKLLNGLEANENLIFYTEFPKYGAEGIHHLKKILDENPDTRLIITDTLIQAIPTITGNGSNQYQFFTQLLKEIQQMAFERKLLHLFVHHTKKGRGQTTDHFDDMHGSTGIFGSADVALMLDRVRENESACLRITGRDVQEQTLPLTFNSDTCQWLKAEPASQALNPTQQKILDCFVSETAILQPLQVVQATGLSPDNARQTMRRMVKDGLLLQKARGAYAKAVTLSQSEQIVDGESLSHVTPPLPSPVTTEWEPKEEEMGECIPEWFETEIVTEETNLESHPESAISEEFLAYM